jgi:hypothetical protein
MARRFSQTDATAPHIRAWALLTEQRAANPSAGSGTGDMLAATYDPNADGIVDKVRMVTAALPAAGAGYEGQFWYVAGSAGVAGTLYFCQRLSGGTFEWSVVNVSSS